MSKKEVFCQKWPSPELEDFVELYWEHNHQGDSESAMTIAPDSFFKIIWMVKEGKMLSYFLTGIWTKEVEVKIQPGTSVYGIKFRILAPEYLFQREIESILNGRTELDLGFLNAEGISFKNINTWTEHIEKELLVLSRKSEEMRPKKLLLSQLLYKMDGDITVEDVAIQIGWSDRQINRYLTKYLGVSLKSYLNMQKVYSAYVQIKKGDLFPEKGYYDQAHFIREVKRHTNQTPKELFKDENDRFIQLKNIHKK